jgi:hypothetical protein
MKAAEFVICFLAGVGAGSLVTCAHESVAQVDPADDPLVRCIDEKPECPYGRVAVCHKGKWYCAADKRAFER